MKLSHIIEKVMFDPWLITVGAYQTVTMLVESKLAGTAATDPFTGMLIPEVIAKIDSDGIATIPIEGVLGSKISNLEKVCGATDYGDIRGATEDALGRGAKGVIYAFNSSGGMVRGCPELADYIKSVDVPTHAFTDSKCNSAAYWLASACNGFTASESSDIGSIGVILPWIDKSKVWEVEGLKYDAITNEGADLKGAGAGPSLNDKQRKYLQDSVDHIGDKFHNFVKSNRKVDSQVFRAGTYFGSQALEMGLIDRVGSYADAHKAILTRVKSSPAKPVSKQIQGKKMTKEELQTQHPELYAQMVQDEETAKKATEDAVKVATAAAMKQERDRLSGLDALSFTPECRAIVDKAKADGLDASAIAVQISQLLAKDNEHLRLQVGVYKGAAPTGRIGSIDPTTSDTDAEKDMSTRLSAHFAKRFGIKGGKN